MTAHAIRQTIAQLRDAGRTSAIVVCPICEGGSRKRRTLSVDLRDGVWLYLCHRGTCLTKGAMPANGTDFVRTKPQFTPRHLEWPLRFPTPEDPIGARILDRTHTPPQEFAARHGLQVHDKDPNTHVWNCWDTDGVRIGHISRDENKTCLTWRILDRPMYASFFRNSGPEFNFSVLVEDCLSAALLAESGVPSIALLGTNLAPETAIDISRWGRRGRITLVALDPDRAGISGSSRALDRLRGAGVTCSSWNLYKDVHKMTQEQRESLVLSMEEWTNGAFGGEAKAP